jgi:hypothetical protein
MAEDFEALLLGGYCYSHRNAGPFSIGEDFEAPGPAARILPRIKIELNRRDELWSFIANGNDINADESSDTEIFDDVTKQAEFESGVSEALNWYVSDCQFQAELPTFRKQLQDLRRAIERFKSDVPDETTSLSHFLFMTYTGEAFLRDQLKPSRRQLIALQDAWRERAGFLAIQDTLNVMLRNIEVAQSLIGNKKPRHHQVKGFVQALAKVWKKATGKWPKSGRDPTKGNQTGPFADFVRATNDILPAPFRVPTLDRTIRAACKRQPALRTL